ncbi:MAG: GCN5-related N-acetyltransferase [Paenibacillaceae bacterium]|nr:GCN5-related N-acetyltransferase [Paenibacillaceae bacterium]
MAYSLREYRAEDWELVTDISHLVYARKTGSFSIVSKLQDAGMLRKHVILDDRDTVAGYGLLWVQAKSPCFILKMENLLHPKHENFVAADLLFSKMVEDSLEIAPDIVLARAFDDQEFLLQLYGQYGFEENHRMVHVYLNLADAGTSSLEVENRLNSSGIRLTTLSDERASDPDADAKLKTLHRATFADYPTEPYFPPTSPNDAWLKHEDNIPEAHIIAVKGQDYIGHSHLMRMPSDSGKLRQGLTAVLRDFRGIGIATALKRRGIDYAKKNGYTGIFTASRSTNFAMRTVNSNLGWQPHYSEVRFEKIIGSEAAWNHSR